MWTNETKLVFNPDSVTQAVRFLKGDPLDMVLTNPAFLFTFLLSALEEPGACLSYTIWTDQTAAEAFFGSPKYRNVVQGVATWATGVPQRRALDTLYLDIKQMPGNVQDAWANITSMTFRGVDIPEVKAFLLDKAVPFAHQQPGYWFNLVLNSQDAPGELTSITLFDNAESGQATLANPEYRTLLQDAARWLQAPPTRMACGCHYLEIREIPEAVRAS